MSESRVIAWFSCGAASAVAAKLAVEKYGERAEVVYCNTLVSEHPRQSAARGRNENMNKRKPFKGPKFKAVLHHPDGSKFKKKFHTRPDMIAWFASAPNTSVPAAWAWGKRVTFTEMVCEIIDARAKLRARNG